MLPHVSCTTSRVARVIYYDARPDDDLDVRLDLREYWDTVIEFVPDTELGFSSTRGESAATTWPGGGMTPLIAVDMLTGAFQHIFSVAVLVCLETQISCLS